MQWTTARPKRDAAERLLAQLHREKRRVVSTQVMLELAHNLTRKLKVSKATAAKMTAAYAQCQVVPADAHLAVIATPRPTPAPFAGGRQVLRGRPRGKPAPHPQAEAKPERAPEPAKTEAPAPRPELHPNPYGM